MLSAEEIVERREAIALSDDLREALQIHVQRAERIVATPPPMPTTKALLSVDGGVCPADGVALVFDPWEAESHGCPRCGERFSGEHHDRHWAKWQHLWLAERTAHLATLGVLAESGPAIERATAMLEWYATHYDAFPNEDNVLGPSRLFFSTYLESIWIGNIVAAGFLLREADVLDPQIEQGLSHVAEEAANLIGEFDEQLSNRQTWHNAALLAIAVWFEDEALANRAIESPTGLISHLLHGFGAEGLWYEGENYHFFALQGLLLGADWARHAGVDFFAEPELAPRIHQALMAPRLSALPDLTFPARKDSRFGISLAQPMYLESWEIGLGASVAVSDSAPADLTGLLTALYHRPSPTAELLESYLHEVGWPAPERRTRAMLSWRTLLEMAPQLPEEPDETPPSMVLESQGLAVLRGPNRYVSVECGAYGGGHGHPDRLHLTVHAEGVPWLLDLGTGSYVSPTLGYYRSTLAHNAPFLGGRSQPPGNAECRAFDVADGWGWVRGRYRGFVRTVVSGPDHVVDFLESDDETAQLVELPWHFQGELQMVSEGRWVPGTLNHANAIDPERFERLGTAPYVVRCQRGSAVLVAHLFTAGELWRLTGPGPPVDDETQAFLLVRATGEHVRVVTVLVWGDLAGAEVTSSGDLVELATATRVLRHQPYSGGWQIIEDGETTRLEGLRAAPPRYEPLVASTPPLRAIGSALWTDTVPALDGSAAGFERATPLMIDHDDQYRRSEIPYGGPDAFSAAVYPVWDDEALYLNIEVRKADPWFRPPGAAPLNLDNEADDIHSDGIQVYLAEADGTLLCGYVIVPRPEDDALQVRRIDSMSTSAAKIEGSWSRTEDGYRITAGLVPEWWEMVGMDERVRFDLLVNEARPGRQRRAGQLVWSGGGGWVWLLGDRQDPGSLGTLELKR